jgi:PAS domain S-box-containing protein
MHRSSAAAFETNIELEVLKMGEEPTYEELEQRVRELEKENIDLKESGQLMQEREKKDEALRESERTYREIFENSSDFIYTLDLKGTLTDANKAAEDLTGYTRNELIGMSYKDFLPEDSHKSILQAFKQVYNEGKPLKDFPIEVIIKDGTKRFFEICVTPLRKGKEVIGYQGSLRDITKRKLSEEELRKSEEHYRSVFQDSRDAIYITTRDGKFIDANQSALDLFGYSREEMASVNALQLYVRPDDSVKFRKEIEKKGFLREYGITYLKKDGTEIDCLVNATVRRANDGTIQAYQGIIHDITARKKVKTQLIQAQKMEAIGTLAGGIAHDFNNILGAIIGYTEIAGLRLPEDNKAKESLKEVLNAGRRARDLVKQILAFSRKQEQEKIPIQISPIVKEGIKLLRSSLPSNIEIRQSIESDTGIVDADPTQIHQILMNLCVNAGHAMRKEGGVLEIGIRNVEIEGWDSESGYLDMTPGPYLLLYVSDTGEGITPDVLHHIFEPYFTTKEKSEGTGLGLSVVHGIVNSYGGTIKVYSEPGKKTTFHVYLPRIKEAKEMVGVEDRPSVLPTGQERVLFVDDELVLVEIGKQMLEWLGYEVTIRTSSVEALELFRRKPDHFDVVITDMTMPNMTGDMLSIELMQIRPDIPIILCTGFSERISEEKAKLLGIKAFVMKPLVIRDLANAVRKALDNK